MGSVGGAYLAVNTPSGYGGTLLDCQTAGTSVLSVSATGAVTAAGPITADALIPSGLAGATAASRYVGGTASAAPSTGTFQTGDYVIDQSGAVQICTGGGSPGTWGALGGMVKFAESVVGVGGAASVTFNSVPQTARHLRVIVSGRGDTAGSATTSVYLNANGDSASNYQIYEANYSGSGPTIFSDNYRTNVFAFFGHIPGGNGTTSYAANTDAVIGHYTNTTYFKCMHNTAAWMTSAGSSTEFISRGINMWNNTAAITSVTIKTNSGNFMQGTIISLYGMD